MAALRFGILSTADIAITKVIPGMRRSALGEVVAIASRDGARAAAVARDLAIPRAHGSYEALLADPDVDAVYIPLPNHLHAEWAIAAAGAGKHVLCEKPLAMTAADAERMAAAADAAGVHLMEAFMYRHHPSWVAALELVRAGRIGELRAVHSWFSYFNDDQANIRNIRAVGGGALYDIGCYNVSLSRLLFDAEPVHVAAALDRDPVGGTDVLTSALLRFPTGIATFTCSTRLESDQQVDIYGTDGRIRIDIPFNIPPELPTRIHLTHGGEPPVAPDTQTYTFEAKDPYAAEVDAFASAILEGRSTPVPATDAVANLRVIERIFATADPG
jgi:predicted dehydrogenase